MITSHAPFVVSPTVSTQWLCDHLGSDTMVVLDASAPRNGGGRSGGGEPSRIPTARVADFDLGAPDPAKREPVSPAAKHDFERAAARHGISGETTVVVYDRSTGDAASQLRWLFHSFGFERVSVLDGGFDKWNREDRPVEGRMPRR
ncbi:rhodanese-like domain-containing protein [Subtercola boreus]|uniref:Rhodanese domain-containing protein n=1 Tax=Subtercola boreus TaxID=120213 RepID=A0A3E0W9F9_9MICO|nr:rhodanese-like domain-containing protein [Subtercola boreus]RFA19875.1 hypothetical protein B7R24_11210 [Subtercola boreus]RFA19942.1 hypothetical protein B7R23_11190 [Subtercola boreus]RFA26335.1 hypothetical protein B7R25_11310 [Subtercola boreus]